MATIGGWTETDRDADDEESYEDRRQRSRDANEDRLEAVTRAMRGE